MAMLVRSEPSQRRPFDGFKEFMHRELKDHGETVASFAANSDYTKQAVDLVVSGYTASPRIRRDLAMYLGYKSWQQMIGKFYAQKEETDE